MQKILGEYQKKELMWKTEKKELLKQIYSKESKDGKELKGKNNK